jgi:hypothetical protein
MGEWAEQIGDSDFRSRVCFDHTRQTHLVSIRWIAVCSTNFDGAHDAKGRNAFFALDAEASAPKAIFELRGAEFGSNGRPGEVDWFDIGGGGAFRVRSYRAGQGYVIESTSLIAGTKDGLGEVARWYSNFNFQGECAKANCPEALNYTVTVEAVALRDPKALYRGAKWNLRMHERGTDCGAPRERTFKVAFDNEAGRYAVPDALLRQSCLNPSKIRSNAQ